jgi:hypothetical protein
MLGMVIVIALALVLVWRVYLHRDQPGYTEERIRTETLGFAPI